jgi:hypothetical protein
MRRRRQHLALAVLLTFACTPDTAPTAIQSPPRTSSGSGSSGSGSSGGSTSTGITVSSASLVGTSLAVRGTGAKGGEPISVDGTRLGTARSDGTFAVTSASFTSPDCVIKVTDGRTSTDAALDPCAPSTTGGGSNTGSNVPTPLTPAVGSSVVQPVRVSWSAPAATATPVDAYNWQVSKNSSFTAVVYEESVNAPATEDAFSGLPNGTYFWRVQAVEHGSPTTGQVQDPWSAPVSFTITGSAAGTPSTPTITFPASGGQYHPYETFYPRWTPSTGADAYFVEYSSDSAFTPAKNQLKKTLDPAHSRDSVTFGDPLTTWVRVRGVTAGGLRGLPSNVVRVVVTYTAPIGPPPTLVSPANGASAQLPITFTWTEVQNPQLEGYTLQIARDSKFTGDCPGIEYCNMLITGTSYTVVSSNQGFLLPRGTHYWRVRSIQGNSSPTLPAYTAWSSVRTFVVP